MAKILVTGASGFIGAKLVEKLLEKGHEVIGCDISPATVTTPMTKVDGLLRLIRRRIIVLIPKQTMQKQLKSFTPFIPHLKNVGFLAKQVNNPKYEHYLTDFTDFTQMKSLFEHVKPEVCYHAGAIANLNYAREHPRETVKVNVDGTANMTHLCAENDVFLNFVSSCCVYGHTPDHPTTEEARKRPAEIYGCTKLAGEQIVLGYHYLYGLRYNIIRPSTVYGEGMRHALSIYIFIDKAMKGEKLPIHGKGTQTRCFIYVDDLVDGLVKLLDAEVGEVNLTGSQELSVLDIAAKVLRLTEKDMGNLVFVADRPSQVMREQISIEKAENHLGWHPKTSIDVGLKKTLDWYVACTKK